jgi:hypothetical protein
MASDSASSAALGKKREYVSYAEFPPDRQLVTNGAIWVRGEQRKSLIKLKFQPALGPEGRRFASFRPDHLLSFLAISPHRLRFANAANIVEVGPCLAWP